MTAARFEFEGHSGARLAARLDRPAGPVRAAALFSHCFTCTKDILAARRIAARLTAEGIAVLRFDFTGLGHSEGEFANTGFTSNVDDLVRAAEALGADGMAPQILVGHSLGGAAAIAAAGRIPSVRAVATIGAPADPAHVLHNLGSSVETIRAEGQAEVRLAGRSFTIGRGFVEDVEAASLEGALSRLGRALMILHAPRDATVGIENAGALFGAAKHPKSFVSLDDADHLLGREADADYAAGVIAAWAARYLDPVAEDPTVDAPPEGVTRVTEAEPPGLRQEIRVAPGHALTADEPASLGGTGTGPTPYGLLTAALGACTTMTLRMYAGRKGMALDRVSVDVTHDRVHAGDCADCETREGRIDVFRRTIRLEGDLSDAERARLIEIADRCPVHRTLEGPVEVVTIRRRD